MIPFIPLLAAGVSAGAGLFAGNQANRQNQAAQQQMAQTQARQMELFQQAQALIPGMQQLSTQYGQGAQGFMGDRAALGQLGQQYGGLIDQMQRLYGQNPAAGALAGLQGLAGQNPVGGILGQLQAAYDRAGGSPGQISDGGSAGALRSNAQGVLSSTDPGVYQEQARLAGNDAMGQLSSQLAARGIASSGSTSRLGAATLSRLYADAAARGQQDRLNAYGVSNSALGQAGQMDLSRTQGQAALNLQAQGQQAGLLGQMGSLSLQDLAQRAGLYGQMGSLGLQNQGQQAGLLGQIGNMLGAQQGNILSQSGLLGNFLQALQGQFGMQQGIAGMYNTQAGALGGMWQQQASQVNPNPYAGLAAGLGALGPAAGQVLDWRARGLMTPQVMPGFGAPAPGFGVTYSR